MENLTALYFNADELTAVARACLINMRVMEPYPCPHMCRVVEMLLEQDLHNGLKRALEVELKRAKKTLALAEEPNDD